jgi:small subunit ribosomal protein S20
MANIKSQIKRNRQNEKRRQLNKSVRSDMKTAVKKVESALASGEETEALIRQAQHKIDVAVVHKRTAARRKSRLVKKTQATESR